MRNSKAFTLIELLVVIAIIAILAAILFPVFAQAKVAAKKASTISNTKQVNTGIQIYLADYDDTFPAGITQRTTGTWRFNNLHPFPENVQNGGGWELPGIAETVAVHWANSTQPYMKNRDLHAQPHQKVWPSPFPLFANVPVGMGGLNYNGFLQFLSSSSVNNASVVPMVWVSDDLKMQGFSVSRPTLRCQATGGLCIFTPNGLAQPGNPACNQSFFAIPQTGGTIWSYGKGTIISYTDSSTKYRRTGFAVAPLLTAYADADRDLYAQVLNAQGTSFSYWPGCGLYPDNYVCFFRPDKDNQR